MRALLAITLILGSSGLLEAKIRHPRRPVPTLRQKLLKKGAWIGAGVAAGKAAGPAGSAAVGGAKYRKDLKAGGKKRTRALAKIGGPIAAGAVAGPPGTAGYEAVEHRHWIKRHLFLHKRQNRK